MNKPKNFTLGKVKIVKNGGLETMHRDTHTEKGITNTVDVIIKNTVNPHPDLINLVNDLKPYLAKCYQMDAFVTLAKSKGVDAKHKKAFKEVLELIENVHKINMDKIAITGVAISGVIEDDKDKRSVIITGTMMQENGSKTALNSPRIKLNTDQFKFESDVQEIINDLSTEVFQYLYEGKAAQLDLFATDDKKTEKKVKDGDLKAVKDVA